MHSRILSIIVTRIVGTPRRRSSQCLIVTLILFAFLMPSAHAQSAESELNLGVASYKNGRYEEAIEHFRQAVELDPAQTTARMYLATACMSLYIPGVQTDDNLHYAEQAIEQYRIVLDSDVPPDTKQNAAKGAAYLYLNQKKFEEAKTYYQKASDFDPNDPEPYYSIGVIDWTTCFQPRMEARASLAINPGDNLNPKIPAQKKVCKELWMKNAPTIEDGMQNLNRAIQLRPDYDDAMAYLNLMYRERADLECDDSTARAEDLKLADHWVDEVMRVKKMKAEKSEHTPPAPQQH